MPACWATGCQNIGGRGSLAKNVNKTVLGEPVSATETVSLHTFPWRKPELLNQWIRNIGRTDRVPNKNSRLCSVHFLESCFEVDHYGDYITHTLSRKMIRSRPKLLKPDTVPTEFSHRQTGKTEPASLQRLNTHQGLSVKRASECVSIPVKEENSNGPFPVFVHQVIIPCTQETQVTSGENIALDTEPRGITEEHLCGASTPEKLQHLQSSTFASTHTFTSEESSIYNTVVKAESRDITTTVPKETSHEPFTNDCLDFRENLSSESINKECSIGDLNFVKLKTEPADPGYEDESSIEDQTVQSQADQAVQTNNTQYKTDDTEGVADIKPGSDSHACDGCSQTEPIQLNETNTIYTETQHGVYGIPGSLHITEEEGSPPVEYVPALAYLPPGEFEEMVVSGGTEEMAVAGGTEEPRKGLVYVPKTSFKKMSELKLVEDVKESNRPEEPEEELEPTEEELFLHVCYGTKHDHPYVFVNKPVSKSVQVPPIEKVDLSRIQKSNPKKRRYRRKHKSNSTAISSET